jgi:hypothetical protein
VSAVFRVDVTSLQVARSDAIWGAVWWEIGKQAYPELEWNDLAVAVVVEMLMAVQDVRRGADFRTVRFFDGPFWIEFTHRQRSVFTIITNGESSIRCDSSEFAGIVQQVE